MHGAIAGLRIKAFVKPGHDPHPVAVGKDLTGGPLEAQTRDEDEKGLAAFVTEKPFGDACVGTTKWCLLLDGAGDPTQVTAKCVRLRHHGRQIRVQAQGGVAKARCPGLDVLQQGYERLLLVIASIVGGLEANPLVGRQGLNRGKKYGHDQAGDVHTSGAVILFKSIAARGASASQADDDLEPPRAVKIAFFSLNDLGVAATHRHRPRGGSGLVAVAATFLFLLTSSALFFANVDRVVPGWFYSRGSILP